MRALVPQSDMWSLAVVAYEAVTGSLSFDGDGLIALAVAIADARFEPPSVHQPQLPRALDAFFLRAFAPAPADRFRNATEMATAFTRAVGVGSDPSLPASSFPAMPASVVTTEPARIASPVPSVSSVAVVVGPVASTTHPGHGTAIRVPPDPCNPVLRIPPDRARAGHQRRRHRHALTGEAA